MTMRNHRSALPRYASGFTLIEMIWVLAVIGILIMISNLSTITRLNYTYYEAKQEATNRRIHSALLNYAKTSTPRGTLPNPYTGGGYNSTVYNPGDTTLAQIFRSADIPPSEINSDGTATQNVRVYQVVQLTRAVPLFFQSGPLTTLTYQYAEVHLTACPLSDATCNRSAPNIPGASATLSSANYKTWTTIAPDYNATMFSTEDLQKQMLALSAQNLNRIHDQFLARFNVNRAAAAATDTTNWYPYPYAAGVPGTPNPDKSGAAAASNQYCWDGWYDLSAANINVLAQVGLSQQQYGKTAWGGTIEYCRDYDPALRGANSLPHFGALRINNSVSLGDPPSATAANNLFISF